MSAPKVITVGFKPVDPAENYNHGVLLVVQALGEKKPRELLISENDLAFLAEAASRVLDKVAYSRQHHAPAPNGG